MEKNGKWRERRDYCRFFEASKAKRDCFKISNDDDDNSMANSPFTKRNTVGEWKDVPKRGQREENQESKSFTLWMVDTHFQRYYL
jgi:hypothetical protein